MASASSNKSPPLPPVSFLALYRFADARDRAAGVVALVCALGSGVVVPVSTLLLGALLNDTSGYAARVGTARSTYDPRRRLVPLPRRRRRAGLLVRAAAGARLRRAYVRALLRQDLAWGEAFGLAEAAAQLAEDSLTVAGGIGEKLFLVAAGAAQFVGSITLAFALAADAWRLALTLLAVLPAAVAAIGGLFTFVAALAGGRDDAYARESAVLAEGGAGARAHRRGARRRGARGGALRHAPRDCRARGREEGPRLGREPGRLPLHDGRALRHRPLRGRALHRP